MVYVIHTHPRKLNATIDGMIFIDGIAATKDQETAYNQRRKHGYSLSVLTDADFHGLLNDRGPEFKHKFRMS